MIDMSSIANIPPFIFYFIGAALLPLFGKGGARKVYLILLAVVGLIGVAVLEPHVGWVFPVLPGLDLTFLYVDRLSLIMGYIFAIIGAAAILYSLDIVKENGELMCGLLYLGSAMGAVFAGDFFTLYIFWEIMAFASLGLIWYTRTERATNAGMRYILFHLFGGCALLAGIIINYMGTGAISLVPGALGIGHFPVEMGIGYFLLLIGIGVNTAFIFLHTWLPDSYPKATLAGAVFMCVFTTKTGVYVLARTFPGAEISLFFGDGIPFIAYLGGLMCVYGVVFALLQNDVRKLLSYHIISQVGYMVAGVGIGTYIGINGGIAHVFNHILYKALLFMCMGAVIYSTGRMNLTELGGLARKMPVTTITCIIAALSISGVVGFNGYVSKGMIIHAAELSHMHILALILMLGSIGTFLSFLKLTYFTFFKRNDEIEAKEAPIFMLIPMCAVAFLCVAFGVYPKMLYEILPYKEVALHYDAFALAHTVGTLELLVMTAFMFFAFRVLIMPHERITYDIDCLYRRVGRGIIWFCEKPLTAFANAMDRGVHKLTDSAVWFSRNPTAASIVLITATCTKLRNPFGSEDIGQERDQKEEKPQLVDEPMEKLSIGSGVMIVLLFFAVYLIVMFLHGWLAP
ncbi:multicomponent Na+:H+ antiporter subunit D [Methanophagales archaeon]|nr:multicomponent Na+:H+ antiporter subunit D [Methanophagales archaeon]